MKRFLSMVAVAAAGCGGPRAFNVAGAPSFGRLALERGFSPSPRVVEGRTSGAVDASALGLGVGCVGWLGESPDHVVVLGGNARWPFVRVFAVSTDDVTLVVRKPDGLYLCNDDSFGGTNPSVEGALAPGAYAVWVGAPREGRASPYRLSVTMSSGDRPR